LHLSFRAVILNIVNPCRSYALPRLFDNRRLIAMFASGRVLSLGLLLLAFCSTSFAEEKVTVEISTQQTPPTWALLERELLRASTAACQEYYDHFFDDRGWLECVERWGGDDGPDDAIENCRDWPVLHALGAPNVVLNLYKRAWEGHLRQYTLARTTDVPFARDGMYYKEFPVMFDWLHNGEGLTVFNLQGLSDPQNQKFQQRVRRFAGFYLNEDPQAQNYDSKHKIIRSMFNGSRGPLLRKATGLDWAGDPIEVADRFQLGHGERSYQEMLDHFKDYNDIVGDHPQNLLATCLPMNAYMLEHDEKYKRWVLEYVDAWLGRMQSNHGIIPTNIGLDGKIGGAAGGKWYGGVYGWGFSVITPQTGQLTHRNTHQLGIIGFMNAYLLTHDDRYLDGWRKQIDAVNSQAKQIDGRTMYPQMYGDKGWYHFTPEKYAHGALEMYCLSLRESDQARLRKSGWVSYLAGENPGFPEVALRNDLATVRDRVREMRKDPTTPDTRLADDPMKYNPACVDSLVELMMGGLPPGKRGSLLYCNLRYFDPQKRRAGIPDDIAALVESMTNESLTLTLANTNQLEPRTVVIQAGGYAEHQIRAVQSNGQEIKVDSPYCRVQLSPGAVGRLVLRLDRFANQPTLAFPAGVGP
jgi:hypothetical protein